MDWVLIFSIQWVIAGAPTTPTTTVNVNYASEELCRAAADSLKAELAAISGAAQTHVRAVCVRRK